MPERMPESKPDVAGEKVLIPLPYLAAKSDVPAAHPPAGPFVSAVTSTLLAGGLLIALATGLKLTMVTAFAVLVPTMTFSAMAIAVSMGWIFVSIGRHKTQPRWVAGCAVFITITMLELLVLTYIASRSS